MKCINVNISSHKNSYLEIILINVLRKNGTTLYHIKSIKFQCIEKICKTLSFTFDIGIEYGEKGYIPQNSFQQGLTLKEKKNKDKSFLL